MTKAKAEMALSKFPKGFTVTLLVGAGAQVESADGQILQNQLAQLGIKVVFKQEDTSTEFNDVGGAEVPARLPVLDDGHRRPGRARDVRDRPGGRRALVLHRATTTRR